MPYILGLNRKEAAKSPTTAGELNFAITRLLGVYLLSKGLSYQNINDCLGALEGAKLELYRRVVAPYEEKKISQNGDAYPPSLLESK